MKRRFGSRIWLPLWVAGLLALHGPLAAQSTGQITGTVSSETGGPLSGASVTISGTDLGTLTDANGRFTISNVPAGQHSVQGRMIGYASATTSVTVASGQVANVALVLTPTAVELEGVIAVGYGTQQRINVTGSIAAVEPEELQKRPVANVAEALQGVAPGLTVIDRGGRPGTAGTDFFIRGRGSTNSTSPLVLIDGIPGDINALDPNDISSISVLKDAASAAIYGSRAANGVILVTTRRGDASGGMQFSYDGYYGIQEVQSFPTMLGPEPYMRLINESYVNAGDAPKYSEEYIQNTLKALNGDPNVDPLRFPFTDWLDVVFNAAPIQDHTFSVRGGNDLATYSLSLNYLDQDGLIPNTRADRYGLRLNTDFYPMERLHAGVDVALRRSSDREPNAMGSVLWNMFHDTPPMTVAKYPDGTYGWSDNGHNPLAYAEAYGTVDRSTRHGLVNARADYELMDGLFIRTQASASQNDWEYRNWRNEVFFRDYWDPSVIRKSVTPNQLDNRMSRDTEIYLRGLLEYTRTFGEHDLTAMAGYDQTSRDWREIRAIRRGFYNNELQEINVGDASQEDTWGTSSEWALRSGFGRINYGYLDRYLFEANLRYDGSSRFAKGNRFGFFPSFSAGWRISQEYFFNIPWINEFKLRGSWGKMGNQEIDLYAFYPLIVLGGGDRNYVFGDQLVPGAAKVALANQDISWEATTMTDFGLDATFLNGRLTFTGDVYRKDSNDILRRLDVSGMIGLNAPVQNALSIRNSGWEVALGWNDVAGEVSYGGSFNIAQNRNEVLDLADAGPFIDGIWLIEVGQPLGTMFGWQSDGLFQSQAEVDAHATQHPVTGVGDIRYVDQNGDGVINDADRVPIGNDMPTFTFGSAWNAAWRGFDASIFLQGAWDVDYWVQGALVEGPFWENYTTTAWLDRWTPDNPNGRMPKPTLRTTHNHQASDYWVYDASYLKLKNAQIGYTLPESFTGRFNANRLRIYVSGQNLLTYTTNDDIILDPETPSGRANIYPQTRTVSIGASLQF